MSFVVSDVRLLKSARPLGTTSGKRHDEMMCTATMDSNSFGRVGGARRKIYKLKRTALRIDFRKGTVKVGVDSEGFSHDSDAKQFGESSQNRRQNRLIIGYLISTLTAPNDDSERREQKERCHYVTQSGEDGMLLRGSPSTLSFTKADSRARLP